MAAVQKEVVVPDIGDFKDIEVIEVLVKPGDVIQPEDSLITLESDKAAMELPSPIGGTVKSLNVKPGDRVSKGSVILTVEVAETAATPPPVPAPSPAPAVVEQPVAPAAAVEPPAPASAAVPSKVSDEEIRVPDIGDFKEIEVIEVLVKPGDTIQAEDSLVTLESDKAAMEVPSPKGGLVKAVHVKAGDRVSQGTPILLLEVTEAAMPAASQPAPVSQPAPPVMPATATEPASAVRVESATLPVGDGKTPAHASPAIRKFARELGVTLARVKGTGQKGRITREDVQQYVKQALAQPPAPTGGAGFGFPPAPEVDFSKYGAVESQPLTRIQKLSGPNLHRNWVSIPHITQHDDADITDLEAFRVSLKAEAEKRGVKLSLLPFVMKAVAASLKAFPSFNASLAPAGDTLILKKYFHIGVAVDTPEGLVVPVIRDVDQKSVFDLGAELMDVSQRARNKKLRGADLEGGCFTISSLGGIGGTAFTPIINAPEVAILGLSRSQMKPVYQNGQFVPRLMLPLSLSYDHRVIDGAQGARFIVHLGSTLADLRRVLL
ncbi:MAG: dihydrolipoyllysine-residue acetyltransferase [Methylococcus sp.]|nr:MAG: dihydrolipoyllysine-residue acetyltransferase [Methylococcus sp.]